MALFSKRFVICSRVRPIRSMWHSQTNTLVDRCMAKTCHTHTHTCRANDWREHQPNKWHCMLAPIKHMCAMKLQPLLESNSTNKQMPCIATSSTWDEKYLELVWSVSACVCLFSILLESNRFRSRNYCLGTSRGAEKRKRVFTTAAKSSIV